MLLSKPQPRKSLEHEAFDLLAEVQTSIQSTQMSEFQLLPWFEYYRVELSATRDDARAAAAQLRDVRLWLFPVAYREARVSLKEAQAVAHEALEVQKALESDHVFSRLQATRRLGNPFAWSFTLEVSELDKPDEVWSRYISVDRLAGSPWTQEDDAKYLGLLIR